MLINEKKRIKNKGNMGRKYLVQQKRKQQK